MKICQQSLQEFDAAFPNKKKSTKIQRISLPCHKLQSLYKRIVGLYILSAQRTETCSGLTSVFLNCPAV